MQERNEIISFASIFLFRVPVLSTTEMCVCVRVHVCSARWLIQLATGHIRPYLCSLFPWLFHRAVICSTHGFLAWEPPSFVLDRRLMPLKKIFFLISSSTLALSRGKGWQCEEGSIVYFRTLRSSHRELVLVRNPLNNTWHQGGFCIIPPSFLVFILSLSVPMGKERTCTLSGKLQCQGK